MKKFYPNEFPPITEYIFLRKKNTFSFKAYPVFLLLMISNLFSHAIQAQRLQFSYSYLNVSRSNGGGTLEKGDTIEVRALVKVNNTTNHFYYVDTIRAGTEYISNSLQIVTNENITYLGPYSDAGNDDRGIYISTGVPRLRINIGASGGSSTINNPTAGNFGNTTGGGRVVAGTDRPRFYGATLFVVSYKLKITAEYDDIIYLTGNYYFDTSGVRRNYRFNYAGIKILRNLDLCTNFSSASFTADSSFGSGTVQNRVLPAAVPGYEKVNLGSNSPQDNYYAIANNTSANGTTNDEGPYASNPARVFNVWDIIGDHTGAADPIAGNPPPPAGTQGGYMLVVNSAYPTGEAYRDTIRNVCPNTYYEFSAWIRNICGKCGIDQNSANTNLPGVQPNLSYTINDNDYFTTGNIPYTRTWVKRGFIYRTGPTETEFRITIKNNAAGGGGNDWVLDDIKLSTCYPNLIMNPGDTAKVCSGSPIHLSDTVKSYFNNYINFCWEKSTDGDNWSSTGVCGTKTPVLENGLWVYVVDTVFTALPVDSASYFRLKVGTTFENLSDSKCAVNNSQKVFLKIFNVNCSVLETNVLNFNGKVFNGRATLFWKYSGDKSTRYFEVERSIDGVQFTRAGTVKFNAAEQNYTFADTEGINTKWYYRLKLVAEGKNEPKISPTIVLFGTQKTFKISALNPFKTEVKVAVLLPAAGEVELTLYDMYGKIAGRRQLHLREGSSQVVLDRLSHLAPGMYIVRAVYNNEAVQHKIFKFD